MKKLNEPCQKACKGRVLNAKRGKYCDCIERKLGESKRSSIRARNIGHTINEVSESIPSWKTETERSKKEVTAHLALYGLADYEIEMIWLRFFEEVPFKDLVKQGGWTSVGAAAYFYRQTISKLRKRGFKWG